MDKVWIINFKKWIKIQAYKCWVCWHNNIGNESSMEVSLFQWSSISKNPEMKLMIYDWFEKLKLVYT